jgi:hypothetical protein
MGSFDKTDRERVGLGNLSERGKTTNRRWKLGRKKIWKKKWINRAAVESHEIESN